MDEEEEEGPVYRGPGYPCKRPTLVPVAAPEPRCKGRPWRHHSSSLEEAPHRGRPPGPQNPVSRPAG